MSRNLRVAFFGLPLAAVLLARDGHELVYAAACRAAPGLRRLLRIAPGRTRLRPDLERDGAVDEVRRAAPDLLVSWFWTTKLPRAVLAIAPSLGVHPSLLPRHRGADPYFWAIDAGDTVTGVTAHRLAPEYDAGAILGHRELAIDLRWNAWQLARALDRPSLGLLRAVVGQFAKGNPPPAIEQDASRATQAPAPSDADLAIRWSWPARRIERRVRAAAPWPGAWTEIGNELVVLTQVRATSDVPRTLAPAEAAVRRDGVAVVRAGDEAIELLAGRREDDTPLGATDFSNLVAHVRG